MSRKVKWEHHEDLQLIKLHKEFGNQWVKISRALGCGKTATDVKNHFYSSKRLKSSSCLSEYTQFDRSFVATPESNQDARSPTASLSQDETINDTPESQLVPHSPLASIFQEQTTNKFHADHDLSVLLHTEGDKIYTLYEYCILMSECPFRELEVS